MDELKYAHVASMFYSEVWAVQLEKLQAMRTALEFFRGGGVYSAEQLAGIVSAGRQQSSVGAIAVLPLHGVLCPRADLMSETSGGTSLERWTAQFRQLVADPSVGAVVVDINSPGGSVPLVEEAWAEVYRSRGRKPVAAVASPLAASAAYWIATAADTISVTPSGEVGSIGVYAAHQDESAARESEGIKTTLISSSPEKVEGNPFEPLSQDARDYMQTRVDAYYDKFLAAVARGRGVPKDAVRANYGKGRVLGAEDALAAGMVDHVETLGQAIDRVARQLRATNAARADADTGRRRALLTGF